jgi:hypothetical protein
MNEQYDPNYQHYGQQGMAPAVPTPYVTHQDMAPVHTRLGSLEQGHTLLQT